MIGSYNEYIRRYVRRGSRTAPPSPGEHHFVAAYLVPKLFAINAKVPDYINPDGTKSIQGDVVYYLDGEHHFGIEVKLDTVRLTKNEFNKWILAKRRGGRPNLFIGVGARGITVTSWSVFRKSYIAAVKADDWTWKPQEIVKGYGPMKSVDRLLPHLPKNAWFPVVEDDAKALRLEAQFTAALRGGLRLHGLSEGHAVSVPAARKD